MFPASQSDMKRFILTGAPGGGKTAILSRIGDEIRTIAEPAREILAEQRAIGGRGTPEQDPDLFVQLLLERSIQKHAALSEGDGPNFTRSCSKATASQATS